MNDISTPDGKIGNSTLDFSGILCHTIGMNKTRLGWATNDKLNDIMEECIRCEKLQRDADRLARAQGVAFGTWTLAQVDTIG